MNKVYIDQRNICKIKKHNKNKGKINSKKHKYGIAKEETKCKLPVEPVLIDKIYDNTEAIGKENSPKCIDFEIISPCKIPFNSSVEIIETKTTVQVKRLNNKIFIQGHEIDFNHELCSNETNKIRIDESLINLCKSKKYPNFDLKVNEWVEAYVDIQICIKGIAYVDECYDEICFEAVGYMEDKICIPLMYNICVPNFIKNNEKPYLKQTNNIKTLVDPNFIFLSALPDCNSFIEKLLGKLVITYGVSSTIESIVPTYLDTSKSKSKNSRKKISTHSKVITINNKRELR